MSAGTTILVADDDRAIRTVLHQALGRQGHTVRSTGTASTLWQWVQEGEGQLVITDVVMPNVSGPTLAAAIRERRPDVKVLFVSGYAEALDADLAQSPSTVLVHKPITRQILVDRVAGLLRGDAGP